MGSHTIGPNLKEEKKKNRTRPMTTFFNRAGSKEYNYWRPWEMLAGVIHHCSQLVRPNYFQAENIILMENNWCIGIGWKFQQILIHQFFPLTDIKADMLYKCTWYNVTERKPIQCYFNSWQDHKPVAAAADACDLSLAFYHYRFISQKSVK